MPLSLYGGSQLCYAAYLYRICHGFATQLWGSSVCMGGVSCAMLPIFIEVVIALPLNYGGSRIMEVGFAMLLILTS